jgi:hypothetical protein
MPLACTAHLHAMTASTVSPTRRGHLDRAARSLRSPSPSWRASTTDALVSRRGEEIRVTSPRRRVAAPLPHRRAPCTAVDIHADVELRNDEHPFVQAARWHCAESACCKPMFQVFQML